MVEHPLSTSFDVRERRTPDSGTFGYLALRELGRAPESCEALAEVAVHRLYSIIDRIVIHTNIVIDIAILSNDRGTVLGGPTTSRTRR